MSNVVSVVFDLPIKKTTSYYKSATSYGRVTTSHRSMSAIYESPFNVGFKFNYKMIKMKPLRFIRPPLYYHSSAQSDDRILLIGGIDSRSTEWIPMDGGPSKQGSFDVRHGGSHCTIQVSSDVIVVTGGHYSFDYVTEYKLAGDATETVMTPLITGRHGHACGVYGQANGQQVIMILFHK